MVKRDDDDEDEMDDDEDDSFIKLAVFVFVVVRLMLLLLFKLIALDLIEWFVLNEEVDEVDDEPDIKSLDFMLLAFNLRKYIIYLYEESWFEHFYLF